MSANVTVAITNGPSVSVPWFENMNAQDALEGAFNVINNSSTFTFAIQYYGNSLGYLVTMIDNLYESSSPSDNPYFYWEFFLNNAPSMQGIDNVLLQQNDVVKFTYEQYNAAKHTTTTVGKKHERLIRNKP